MSLGSYVRSFLSSRRVANKSQTDSGDANRDNKIYLEDGSLSGLFDTEAEALWEAVESKGWKGRVVKLENGMETWEHFGRIVAYINPIPRTIKDILVDKHLVDDFGGWSLDELSEGQLTECLAEDCQPP